jgi:hypothetical protein
MVGIHRRLGTSWLASVMVSMFGLKSYLSVAPPARQPATILSIAVFANARRAIVELGVVLGEGQITELAVGNRNLLRPRALVLLFRLMVHPRRCFRYLRLLHRLRHDNFLVACRVAGVVALYVRMTEILEKAAPRAVLVASDSNPEEVALKLAARSLGIPSIFLSHAYTTPVSPPLRFDLSIIEGAAALEAYKAKGPVRGAILFRGVEGASSPLDPQRFQRSQPTIGFFTPKIMRWDAFAGVIRDCQQRFGARQILIRWHPNMLEEAQMHLLDDPSNVVQTPRSASLGEVVAQCDWVIADENSNVNLEVLKRGIPTINVRGLSGLPADRSDIYGFVRNQIIFPPVDSIAAFDLAAAMEFYTGTWPERFRAYDATYLRDEEQVKQETRDAIANVIAKVVPGVEPISARGA